MSDEQLAEHTLAVKKLEEVRDHVVQIIEHLPLRLDVACVKMETEEHYDPSVFIDGFQVRYENNYGTYVYAIYSEKIIHGCHTLSNGDPGYPDEVDYIEEDVVKTASHAAKILLKLYCADAVEQAYQERLIPTEEEITDQS